MNEKHADLNEEKLVRLVKTQLDAESGNLDASTLTRLRQARRDAVSQLATPASSGTRRPFWRRAAAATALSVLALALMLTSLTPPDRQLDLIADDNEILTDEGGIELFAELDFYLWLENQDLGASDA